jgi:hypothetical protein
MNIKSKLNNADMNEKDKIINQQKKKKKKKQAKQNKIADAHHQPLRNLDLIYSIGANDKEIQIYMLT